MTRLARIIGLDWLPARMAVLGFPPAQPPGGYGGVGGAEFVFAIDWTVNSMPHLSLPSPLRWPDHDDDRRFGFGLGFA